MASNTFVLFFDNKEAYNNFKLDKIKDLLQKLRIQDFLME